MKIEIIKSREELSGKKSVWDTFSQTNFPQLCNSFCWNNAAINNIFKDSDFRVIFMYDSSDLAGIIPLCRTPTSFMKMPVRKYHFFGLDEGMATLMIRPDFLENGLELLWNNAGQYLDKFHLLHLGITDRQLASLSQVLHDIQMKGNQVFLKKKKNLGLHVQSKDELWKEVINTKRRKEYRRKENLLKKNFAFEMTFPDTSDVKQNFEQYWSRFIDLYEASRKQESSRSVSQQTKAYGFYHHLLTRFSQREKVYLSFLKLDGQDAASVWWVEYQGTLYGIQTAFDNKYYNYSPGMYLIQNNLTSLIEAGWQSFNFMGSQSYKKFFSNVVEHFADIYIFSNRLYPKILASISPISKAGFERFSLDAARFEEIPQENIAAQSNTGHVPTAHQSSI